MTCALTLHSRLLGATSEILSKKRHLCPPVPCPPVCWAAGRKGGRAGPQQVGRKEPAQELPTCLQRWSLQPLRLELLSSGTGFAGTRELEGKPSWHRVTLQTDVPQSRGQPSAHCTGPSCRLMTELGSPAQLFNNALINYCKLQRTH